MKAKYWLIITGFSALLFTSCDFFDDLFNSDSGPGETGYFWAFDLSTDEQIPYQARADLSASGVYCEIWTERGSGITMSTAREIADEFDNKMYHAMLETFSPAGSVNLMDYANNLVNGNGKMTIFFLEIKDGYIKGVNESFIAGYFWRGNFYTAANSNRRSMVYIDIKEQAPGSSDSYGTIAHEMQHLMNFAATRAYRGSNINIVMDTWIDEGLSEAAEWVYSGNYNEGRLRWFAEDIQYYGVKGLVSQGNNFYVWGNRGNQSLYAILDDYATVNLFFHWLRLQAGSKTIYGDIIKSTHSDYRAVLNAMNDKGYDTDWPGLLRDWLAANYINAQTGPHGYMGDPVLSGIKANFLTGTSTVFNLFPGEGVYTQPSSNYNIPSAAANNIRYAGLSAGGDVSSSGTVNSSGALLTYNINPNNANPYEQGTVIASSISMGRSESLTNAESGISRPFAVSAGDMLRRNAQGDGN